MSVHADTLGMATTMPAYTDRYHLLPYWLGDSPAAVRKEAKRPVGKDGGHYIDINLQRTLDGAIAMHWGTPGKNGYFYIWTGKKNRLGREIRRELTKAEINKPLLQWKTADVIRLRRTLKQGIRYVSRVRPYTYLEMARVCKKFKVIPCFELKSPQFRSLPVAQSMIAALKKENLKAYWMTLVTMPFWGAKAKAFHTAGGPFALLAHGAEKPSNFATYKPFIDRVWGSWAK